jgi:hypothetical protein
MRSYYTICIIFPHSVSVVQSQRVRKVGQKWFYNVHPNRTLAIKRETCYEEKKYKLTMLICYNEERSEKLWPIIMGKFEKPPHCMKNMKNCLCEYKPSHTAWVTVKIFCQWLLCSERTLTDRNILLPLDQCAAHNHTGLPMEACFLYLPPKTTTHMQSRVSYAV